MSDALVRAMAAKAYSLESEDVQQAIRAALLLNGLCATSVDVRRLASRAIQIVMALPSRHCLFTCLCVSQVGNSPTMPSSLRSGFAAAVTSNKEVETTLAGRNESCRRASLYCTLAALCKVPIALTLVDEIAEFFEGNEAQKALLCNPSSPKSPLTVPMVSSWALELPGHSLSPAGGNRLGLGVDFESSAQESISLVSLPTTTYDVRPCVEAPSLSHDDVTMLWCLQAHKLRLTRAQLDTLNSCIVFGKRGHGGKGQASATPDKDLHKFVLGVLASAETAEVYGAFKLLLVLTGFVHFKCACCFSSRW
jgi:hypothetical protein